MNNEVKNAISMFGVKMPAGGWRFSSFLSTEEQAVKQEVESKTYCYNNGKYVLGLDGDVFMVFSVPGFEELLEKAGFRSKGIMVPFSNGEKPLGNLAQPFEDAEKRADAVWHEYFVEKSVAAARMRMGRTLTPAQMEVIENSTIAIDGKKTVSFYGEEYEHRPISDLNMADRSGTYDYNNGTYVIIMPDGSTRVGPSLEGLAKVIEDANFERGGIFVPLSNGEKLVDPADNARWEKLRAQSRKELEDRYTARAIAAAKARMGRDLKPEQLKTIEETTIVIDGQRTVSVYGQETEHYPIDTFSKERVVGKYDYNNGTYVIVMPDGTTRVGPSLQALAKVVEDAHFERGSIFVPLSNGEKLVDPTVAAKWEKLREQSRNELNGGSFGPGGNN